MADDKSKEKKKRVLGWGMAEDARKKIKEKRSKTDAYLDSIMKPKPKKKDKKDSK